MFANSGVIITDRLMVIFGADILIVGLLARKVERAGHAQSGSGADGEKGVIWPHN